MGTWTDGSADLILWRAATSHYSYRLSPDYSTDRAAELGGGQYPLVGDLNDDGRIDLGSYDSRDSTFRFTYSPDFVGIDLRKTHGMSGDVPILADVNGDGASGIGIFRGANAAWSFSCSPNWSTACMSKTFGRPGDLPIYGKPAGMP